MPKSTIKEIDNTSSTSGVYSSFAVVVPGFVSTEADTSVFDENGVYEVSTKDDFIAHVGKIRSVARDAKAPVLVDLLDQSGDSCLERTLTHSEAFVTYAGRVYKRTEISAADGRLSCSTNSATCLKGTYKKVSADDFDDSVAYCVILAGNEGNDKETYSSFGNQIAYELIVNLGYTVLYKKLSSIEDLDSDDFWSPLKDKANYDFRYACTGLIDHNAKANACVSKLVDFVNTTSDTGRGDCVALLDVSNDVYSASSTQSKNIKDIIADVNVNFKGATKYSAIFAPTVTYDRVEDSIYQNNTLPASFHYLACAAEAFETYPEWFSVAGYTRGVSTIYKVLKTSVTFGEAAINALEPRFKTTDGPDKAINLIAKIKKSYYIWGNRTAHVLEEKDAAAETGDLRASHFLNIRQLCCTLKKQLQVNCQRFTFEPNSDVLWINFKNAIEPLLDKMKANQGIDDYRIIKVKTAQKATFSAIIRIVPIEAVEDFDLTVSLEDSISGTAITIEE